MHVCSFLSVCTWLQDRWGRYVLDMQMHMCMCVFVRLCVRGHVSMCRILWGGGGGGWGGREPYA